MEEDEQELTIENFWKEWGWDGGPHWICSITRKVHKILCICSLEHQHSHILSGVPNIVVMSRPGADRFLLWVQLCIMHPTCSVLLQWHNDHLDCLCRQSIQQNVRRFTFCYFFMFCSLALIWSFIHANTLDLESCHFISPLDFGGIYVCNLLRLPTLTWYTTLITGKLRIPCISLLLYICLHLINTLWWYLQTASWQQLCTTILFVLLVLLVHLDIKQAIDFKLHQHQVLAIRYLQKTTEKLLITTSCWWWHLPRNVELDTGRMISPQITWRRRESHTTWTIHTLKWIESGYNELTWILQGTLIVHWDLYERRREVCG